VYIAGDPELLPWALKSAALLSLGRRSALSHRSAALLWGLTQRRGEDPVDVTLVAKSVRSREGVRTHLVGHTDSRDVRIRQNLRVTAPARTVIDFAATAPSNELSHALGEGVALGLASDRELQRALARLPANHPGAAIVRSILTDQPDLIRTRSPAERHLLPLVLAAGLPKPLVNTYLCGEQVDLYWPAQQLVVEVDGYQFHSSRLAFERDRRRDAKLVAAGYRVIRVTWPQLANESHMVIARIAQALAAQAG
jgi:hypothetical protein